VHDVLRHEFLHCRSLEIQEKQANEAAEAARKEQVILACARRDAARAAANMQQRHLEAACQLDGSAARAAFESARAEEVARSMLPSGGGQPPNIELDPSCRLAPTDDVSSPPARCASQLTTTTTTTSTKSPVASPCTKATDGLQSPLDQWNNQVVLQERCRKVVSEVERKLNRWKDHIRTGSSATAMLEAEPSLTSVGGGHSPSKNRDGCDGAVGDNVKLLRTEGGGSNVWPTLFSFSGQ